jgi:hypothetical protein
MAVTFGAFTSVEDNGWGCAKYLGLKDVEVHAYCTNHGSSLVRILIGWVRDTV